MCPPRAAPWPRPRAPPRAGRVHRSRCALQGPPPERRRTAHPPPAPGVAASACSRTRTWPAPPPARPARRPRDIPAVQSRNLNLRGRARARSRAVRGHLHFRRLSISAPRILLVDDELSVQKLLAYPLRKEGYDVIPALDGREALDRLRDDNFDLVVLDVMLPRMDGFDVCRAIRSRSTVPIIMLTAKTEETDKVLGLELGADNYITKPFSVREFRSRVKAVLRRAALAQPEAQFEEAIREGDLVIDFERRQVTARGEPVRLTYVEFEVLAALARNPGRVFSRTMLLERVWGDSSYRDPRTIDVHIRHLREKLETEPKHPELILTVRGVGYRFQDT